jgi:predicted dehydrogenase
MMKNENIRIGFVGAGGNTRGKHIPKFQAIPGVELIGVANRSEASSRKVVDAFGMPRVFKDWQALVQDTGIDAVCIGTWPYMHCPVTIAALEAGKHVLCEARMAMNAEEAKRMKAAADAHPGLIVQVVPSPFTLQIDPVIVQTLESGVLGDLVHVDVTSRSRNFPDFESPMSWRQDKRLSGNNIMGMGIFYEAAMRWVGTARTVQANGHLTVAQRPDADGVLQKIEIPDHVDVSGELENGASYHYQFSAVTGGGPESSCWMYGTKATLQVDFAAMKLTLTSAEASEPQDLTPEPGTHAGWRVEEEFTGAIRGEEPIRFTTFADGVRYMEFTDAVTESCQSGQRIEL